MILLNPERFWLKDEIPSWHREPLKEIQEVYVSQWNPELKHFVIVNWVVG